MLTKRPDYYVQTGSMFENPYGVQPSEIWSMVDDLGPEMAAQVVFGKYVELSGLVFTAELVRNLFDYTIKRIPGSMYLDKDTAMQARIDAGSHKFDTTRYVHGADLARKKDYTVLTTLDTGVHPAKVVYWRRLNRVPWAVIYAELGRAKFLFPGELLIDETGIGDVIKGELESRLYCPIHHRAFEADSICPGGQDKKCEENLIFRFEPNGYIKTSATKVQLVNHLQACMGNGYDPQDYDRTFGLIKCPPIVQLQEEITDYAWDDKKLMTDCVMSLGLAAWQGIHLSMGDPAFGSPIGDYN